MWDVELARKIMQQGRQKLPQVWHRAEVVQTTPKLVFSIFDGEATACALLDGAQLLVLDAM